MGKMGTLCHFESLGFKAALWELKHTATQVLRVAIDNLDDSGPDVAQR